MIKIKMKKWNFKIINSNFSKKIKMMIFMFNKVPLFNNKILFSKQKNNSRIKINYHKIN
jgi:hypothetical protein